MSSILNSISSGDLLVRQAPRDTPIKEDSIIDLLQNSEIEFATCPNIENNLDIINTGFGANNDLYYDAPCSKPELKTPLYVSNYLSEFTTEEEKAAARHALGLYNKGDVVAMSMLTAEDSIPGSDDWTAYTIKQLRKGDQFFAPVTSFDAVYDLTGTTLTTRMYEVNLLITELQKAINKILQRSSGDTIDSLGDVKAFLQGFSNEGSLYTTLEDMNHAMLRFEKTGQIS